MESTTLVYSVISVIAMVVSPILAIQVQSSLEKWRISKERKIGIFKDLMSTRGEQLSAKHVEALNRIEMEFGNQNKYKQVVLAWKTYFDHLCENVSGEVGAQQWNIKKAEYFTSLLYEMGNSLGFSFDKIAIKRNIYLPQFYGNNQKENADLKKSIIQIANGEKSISISINRPCLRVKSPAFKAGRFQHF